MGKYDSPYYNSERYSDPTAGAALMNLIREERKTISIIQDSKFKIDQDHEFARIFSAFYNMAFGPNVHGKTKRLGQYREVEKLLTTYNYCTVHVNDEDFSIERAIDILGLGSGKTIEQVFTGNGNMGKVITCYKEWLNTGRF